ncbi:MAG: TetR/AcrR family transcriptional regulator [Peptococcaceae bacterium]|nr:TetR/AcrR family transcriptional regulator [Peptococcaceae bacterium]
MENFLNIPQEKQKKIIDAALICFGTNGYRKSSVSDIATAAGISKALIFHYFGTKKALYLYCLELCGNIAMCEFNEKFDNSVTDFFDRIMLLSDIKIAAMKKHPAMLSFLNSVYFENDDEVKADIQTILTNGQGGDLRTGIAFACTDIAKFKDGIDPKLVMKILIRLTDGYLSKIPVKTRIDLDALHEELVECINLLKNNFYKEQYL